MSQKIPHVAKAVIGGNGHRLKYKLVLLIAVPLLVLGGGAYGLYRVMHHDTAKPKTTASTNPSKAGEDLTAESNAKLQQQSNVPKTVTAVNNTIVTTQTFTGLGQYLADANNQALYTYGKDKSGVSNCTGSCLATWPIYKATTTTGLPTDVSTIKRDDGTLQYTYKGMPLYYFASDGASQVTGDGLNDFHVARL